MGITGLLPALRSVTKQVQLSAYKGKTVGVDGYCWLHRGTYSCAMELCQGIPTDRYTQYFMNMVGLLRHHGVEPYVVFDGARLPAKGGEEAGRRQARADNLSMGKHMLRVGRRDEARQYFSKAVDVTPAMAYRVILELRRVGVKYVVAPYEADAQLAFLAQNGHVDAVVTEDSDLLPYGVERVLFKLNREGVCSEIKLRNIRAVDDGGMKLLAFDVEMLRTMCILSGCDYLESLQGVGLKRAYALVHKYRRPHAILEHLRRQRSLTMPVDYEVNFWKAVLTFKHQRVFDPATRKVVPLTPLHLADGDDLAEYDFLGPPLGDAHGVEVCMGHRDPISGVLFRETVKENAPRVRMHRDYALMTQHGAWTHNNTQQQQTVTKFFQRAPPPGPAPVAAPVATAGTCSSPPLIESPRAPLQERKPAPKRVVRAARPFKPPRRQPPEKRVVSTYFDTERAAVHAHECGATVSVYTGKGSGGDGAHSAATAAAFADTHARVDDVAGESHARVRARQKAKALDRFAFTAAPASKRTRREPKSMLVARRGVRSFTSPLVRKGRVSGCVAPASSTASPTSTPSTTTTTTASSQPASTALSRALAYKGSSPAARLTPDSLDSFKCSASPCTSSAPTPTPPTPTATGCSPREPVLDTSLFLAAKRRKNDPTPPPPSPASVRSQPLTVDMFGDVEDNEIEQFTSSDEE